MDRQQFTEEMTRLRPTIVGVARSIVGDGPTAEDIAQDTILKLWSLHDSLKMPADAIAKTVARNLALDFVRRRKPATVSIDSAQAANAALPDDDAADEQLARMMEAVGRLPDAWQITVRLRHIEGMDYADIASLTGTTPAAVRQTVSRARKALRDSFLTHAGRNTTTTGTTKNI